MQFSGNLKGKTLILSNFWAQGPPLGSKIHWPPWPKSWIRAWETCTLNKERQFARMSVIPSRQLPPEQLWTCSNSAGSSSSGLSKFLFSWAWRFLLATTLRCLEIRQKFNSQREEKSSLQEHKLSAIEGKTKIHGSSSHWGTTSISALRAL